MHAWKGYRSFALGFDELHPVTKSGADGLGGLGATVIDALDTAMIMRLDDVVQEAGSWIQKELLDRIAAKGQVNGSLISSLVLLGHSRVFISTEGFVVILSCVSIYLENG